MRYLRFYIVLYFCFLSLVLKGNGKVDSLLANGYELIHLRNYAAALNNFSKAVNIEPENVKSYIGRAEVERILGKYDDAIQDVHKALSIDGQSAEAYYAKGRIHQSMEKYQEAIIAFDKAIENNKNLLKARGAKANTYIMMGESRQAEKLIEKGLERNPDFGDYYFYLGKLNAERNKYEKAIENFNIVFERETNISRLELYLSRGEALLSLNRFLEAKGDFEKALIIEPNDASALHGLGVANYNLENYDKALDNFNQSIHVIEENPERYEKNPETYYNLGMTYYRMQERINACKYFHIGCRMNNKNSCKMVILQCTGK